MRFLKLVVLILVFTQGLYATLSCHQPFREELEKRSLQYFLDHTHQRTGLVLDRAPNLDPKSSVNPYAMASIAATGFGIAVLANAAEKGILSKKETIEKIARTLRFALQSMKRYRGWFYHFVDWETGARWKGCEISTIDTALFIAGALYSAEALQSETLRELSNKLYSDLDFIDMMTDGGKKMGRKTLSMGWTPEHGYLPYHWDQYAEHLLLVLLGLGHPKNPLPLDAWTAWKRQTFSIGSVKVIGPELPLFAHQYSGLFFDFRRIATDKEDFFTNSVRGTDFNREACKLLERKFITFREGFWGVSASDSKEGYFAFSPMETDGTVCPACVGASAFYAPCPILSDLETWSKGKYSEKIWGHYGFTDSFNLDKNWVDSDVIGITVGALYLSLANTSTKSALWNNFHSNPAIQKAEEKIKMILEN